MIWAPGGGGEGSTREMIQFCATGRTSGHQSGQLLAPISLHSERHVCNTSRVLMHRPRQTFSHKSRYV